MGAPAAPRREGPPFALKRPATGRKRNGQGRVSAAALGEELGDVN